jgi:hypothetical protein
LALLAATALSLLTFGCASPGPPHAPSLYLPKPVTDLTAQRDGDRVELRFTAPLRTSDNLPLKPRPMHLTLCREAARTPVDHPACVPIPSATRDVQPGRTNAPNLVTLTDTLPSDLTNGPDRLLAYRIQLLNTAGQSAGPSEPAYTAAGTAPPPVQDLHAEGTRLGVLLHWHPANLPDTVVLQRTRDTKPVRLATNSPDRTLDTSALPEIPYLYSAQRERSVRLGGRTVLIRSTPSPAVAFILHLVYPPPAPTGLTAVGFTTAATATVPATFAVDLIWQPVDTTGLLAGLSGYNIYRSATTSSQRTRLNTTPIPVPAFHDTTAAPATRYRYTVTAVDTSGNESPAATTTLDQH